MQFFYSSKNRFFYNCLLGCLKVKFKDRASFYPKAFQSITDQVDKRSSKYASFHCTTLGSNKLQHIMFAISPTHHTSYRRCDKEKHLGQSNAINCCHLKCEKLHSLIPVAQLILSRSAV